MRRTLALLLLLMASPGHAATCHGQDLIAALPADQRAALQARADAQPFTHGNLWTATKDGQQITLAGTYHLADPRFGPMLDALAPALAQATVLLVEAGPEEEAALKAKIAADPSVMFLPKGPGLAEQLGPEDWALLSKALKARGMFPFMAAKMQPWLVASMLEMPACLFPLDATADLGLDKQLMAKATARHLPIKALEPYDTVLAIFAKFTPADQIAMLTHSVAADAQSEDLSATLATAYFAGDSRLYYEYAVQAMQTLPGMTKDKATRELALVDRTLIFSRNASWVPVLELAAQTGPVLAAFGALHLPGEDGVLNLLAQRGWTVIPLQP